MWTVPFSVEGHLIVVDGQVQGLPGRFIVDTGAGALVLDRGFAERAGLHTSTPTSALGAGETVAGQFAGATIRLGETDVACPAGVVLPLADIAAGGGPVVDGIVGYDLFAAHVVEVDRSARMLRFFRPGTVPDRLPRVVLPIATDRRVPVVRAQLIPESGEPIPGRLVLDSGTAGGVDIMLGGEFVAAHRQLMLDAERGLSAGTGFGGARLTITAVKLRELRLGELCFPDPATGVIATADGAFHSGLFDGTIGFELFRDRVVVLDYPERRVLIS